MRVRLKADGRLVVLELKTGVRRAAHQRQLEIYVAAAEALHPGAAVEGRVIYV